MKLIQVLAESFQNMCIGLIKKYIEFIKTVCENFIKIFKFFLIINTLFLSSILVIVILINKKQIADSGSGGSYHLKSTCQQYFFLFVNVLTSTDSGIALFEKLNIFEVLVFLLFNIVLNLCVTAF